MTSKKQLAQCIFDKASSVRKQRMKNNLKTFAWDTVANWWSVPIVLVIVSIAVLKMAPPTALSIQVSVAFFLTGMVCHCMHYCTRAILISQSKNRRPRSWKK